MHYDNQGIFVKHAEYAVKANSGDPQRPFWVLDEYNGIAVYRTNGTLRTYVHRSSANRWVREHRVTS